MMDAATPVVDVAPVLRLAGLALVIALLPLSWVWVRSRGRLATDRLAALTTVTLFLTFDLVVFGAFTRLTDSGLGCPDWPGCYGEASPLGARDDIHAAQTAMPTGPVTFTKAWIEMIHRYLAMTVGVLIVVMCAASWVDRRTLPISPWWPTVTLAWVIVQGLFGKYTVTLKLYPAIVTLHLLGGAFLIALLVWQRQAWRPARQRWIEVGPWVRHGLVAACILIWCQVALGGWVSTNYAVLACRGFPQCNGQWWPHDMAFAEGFTLLRELGQAGHGGYLSLDALVAIHFAHRLFAICVVAAMTALVVALRRSGNASLQRYAFALALLTTAQLATGASNVVLDWPLVAALAHTAGAAALVGVTTSLLARARVGSVAPAMQTVAGAV